MLIKNRIRNLFLLGINHLLCFNGAWAFKRGLLKLSGMKIGARTKIVGPLKIDVCSNVSIGEDCWIGRNVTVYGNADVTIGNRCDIAPDVSFATGTHKIGSPERRAGEGYCKPIRIGDGCWIGLRSTILADVTIGASTVIGAASVVTRSLEQNAVYAGSPAKKIRDL